ncbi:7-deoxyloganetin glucosyltransferase-like [Tasmannia lanceolata]|uniref:7-deoxyloganetin glucosyltransferase-like n=1 Tax=Tasmannia lanceolata TaxID=3420 RepID=UPI004062BB57
MSSVVVEKPHVVLIPFPAQGHINPLLKLAKLLHNRGFYITFINTEFNHQRLLKSRGPDSLNGLDDFRFETIPDGLPPSDQNATQDITALSDSIGKNFLVPFCNLVTKLNNTRKNVPRVTHIISDGIMSFTLDAGEELCIPVILFWTPSACGFMAYLHFAELIKRGLTPLKDERDLTNGYLDTRIDWIPGMKHIRLRDFPIFIRTTDPEDIMLDSLNTDAQKASRALAIIINTFNDLEHKVLDVISSMVPKIYTIGPLALLCNKIPDGRLRSIGSNLWKEETECLEWLDTKEPNSVVYVNFGSITVMSPEQLKEFAWGLANSKHCFLWITRPDLVMGGSTILLQEFIIETKERGLVAGWCPQEEVLSHPSVGVFLTHCGWNSTLESICNGVPVLCWPFFSEQPMNCRFACTEWAIGMEIDSNVKRREVEGLVRELMEGEKGKEMRNKAIEWKESARKAIEQGGSSFMNLDKLVKDMLLVGKVNKVNK